MKVLLDDKSWEENALAEFGHREPGLFNFNGDRTGLLKAIRAAVETEGYDPDEILFGPGGFEKKAVS